MLLQARSPRLPPQPALQQVHVLPALPDARVYICTSPAGGEWRVLRRQNVWHQGLRHAHVDAVSFAHNATSKAVLHCDAAMLQICCGWTGTRAKAADRGPAGCHPHPPSSPDQLRSQVPHQVLPLDGSTCARQGRRRAAPCHAMPYLIQHLSPAVSGMCANSAVWYLIPLTSHLQPSAENFVAP